MIQFVHCLAKHNQLTESSTSALKFMVLLSDKIQKSDKFVEGSIHHNLVNLIWTLVYRESQNETSPINPLIPKLLENLYNYKREKPLDNTEYLELFQIY